MGIADFVQFHQVGEHDGSQALADKLTILLEDRAIVRLLAERAFCVVKERFNPESAARKTEELYSDILRSKGYDLTEYA